MLFIRVCFLVVSHKKMILEIIEQSNCFVFYCMLQCTPRTVGGISEPEQQQQQQQRRWWRRRRDNALEWVCVPFPSIAVAQQAESALNHGHRHHISLHWIQPAAADKRDHQPAVRPGNRLLTASHQAFVHDVVQEMKHSSAGTARIPKA